MKFNINNHTIVLLVSEDNLVALDNVCLLVGVGPLNVENKVRVDWLLIVSSVTDFLGDILANSDWNFLVLGCALLAGHILTLLQGLVVTNLVRDLTAVLPRNIHTLLFGDIVTHWVGHLLLLGLGHVLAVVVGILLAGPGDLSPDLVVAMALPLELAVLLVLCGALSLRVRFILRLVLVNTEYKEDCRSPP